MDLKTEAFRNHLASIIPDSTVWHTITANNKHKYVINTNGPPHCHWLFVQRIFIEDKTEHEMIKSFAHSNAPNLLRGSRQPLRLYLSNEGLKPVDEHFS